MLPHEFLQEYGTVQVVTLSVADGIWSELLPDPYRYLVVFPPLADDSEYHIQPSIDTGNEIFIFKINKNVPPFIFTHALHGSLVSSGWRVRHNQLGITRPISILVGRMEPPKTDRENIDEQ